MSGGSDTEPPPHPSLLIPAMLLRFFPAVLAIVAAHAAPDATPDAASGPDGSFDAFMNKAEVVYNWSDTPIKFFTHLPRDKYSEMFVYDRCDPFACMEGNMKSVLDMLIDKSFRSARGC